MGAELKKLSDAATPGEWLTLEMPNYGSSPSDNFKSYGIEASGKTLADTLNSSTAYLEQESDGEGGYEVWDEQGRRDMEFIAALVNAYRAGRLIEAA